MGRPKIIKKNNDLVNLSNDGANLLCQSTKLTKKNSVLFPKKDNPLSSATTHSQRKNTITTKQATQETNTSTVTIQDSLTAKLASFISPDLDDKRCQTVLFSSIHSNAPVSPVEHSEGRWKDASSVSAVVSVAYVCVKTQVL